MNQDKTNTNIDQMPNNDINVLKATQDALDSAENDHRLQLESSISLTSNTNTNNVTNVNQNNTNSNTLTDPVTSNDTIINHSDNSQSTLQMINMADDNNNHLTIPTTVTNTNQNTNPISIVTTPNNNTIPNTNTSNQNDMSSFTTSSVNSPPSLTLTSTNININKLPSSNTNDKINNNLTSNPLNSNSTPNLTNNNNHNISNINDSTLKMFQRMDELSVRMIKAEETISKLCSLVENQNNTLFDMKSNYKNIISKLDNLTNSISIIFDTNTNQINNQAQFMHDIVNGFTSASKKYWKRNNRGNNNSNNNNNIDNDNLSNNNNLTGYSSTSILNVNDVQNNNLNTNSNNIPTNRLNANSLLNEFSTLQSDIDNRIPDNNNSNRIHKNKSFTLNPEYIRKRKRQNQTQNFINAGQLTDTSINSNSPSNVIPTNQSSTKLSNVNNMTDDSTNQNQNNNINKNLKFNINNFSTISLPNLPFDNNTNQLIPNMNKTNNGINLNNAPQFIPFDSTSRGSPAPIRLGTDMSSNSNTYQQQQDDDLDANSTHDEINKTSHDILLKNQKQNLKYDDDPSSHEEDETEEYEYQQHNDKNLQTNKTDVILNGNNNNNIPYYTIYKAPSDVETIWREYTVGINGKPSIQSLEKKYGSKWRLNRNRKTYARRKRFYKFILQGIKNGHTAEDMITELEKRRLYRDEKGNVKKRSVGWLQQSLSGI